MRSTSVGQPWTCNLSEESTCVVFGWLLVQHSLAHADRRGQHRPPDAGTDPRHPPGEHGIMEVAVTHPPLRFGDSLLMKLKCQEATTLKCS